MDITIMKAENGYIVRKDDKDGDTWESKYFVCEDWAQVLDWLNTNPYA